MAVEEQIALPNRIKLRILSPDLLAHVGIHILLCTHTSNHIISRQRVDCMAGCVV